MATRVNRKTANTASPKEIVAADKSNKQENTNEGNAGVSNRATAKTTSIGKRLAKRAATKLVKKPSIAIKLKAKAKKTRKINTKLAKTLLQNAKTLENKKKLLKNGVKEGKPIKRKAEIKKEKYDAPPVLEPIFPLEENVETKKQPKKRTKKLVEIPDIAPELVDVKKIKIEDDDLSLSSDVTDISSTEIPNLKKQVKKRGAKKIKVENETIEDVMNDLTYLIKKDEIKTEVDCMSETGKGEVKFKKLTKKQKMELIQNDGLDEALNSFPVLIKKEEIKTEVDSMSESGKSETKPKKLTKKQRLELLKSKVIKKENIENTLNKLDPSEEKVIDMLDLNVRNIKRKSSLAKRRHSIEKCPVGTLESSEGPISQLLFSQLPRSISPRSKRNTKVRQSIDSLSGRSSLYSTRSDSPGRILRNGKQRALKDKTLLEGLESDSKKRKKYSDLSGNDYESDSSFSDLASLGGAETVDTENSTKTSIDGAEAKTVNTAQNGPVSNLGIVDTNSNVCNNLNEKLDFKTEPLVVTESSSKLPQKKALLDIMKQTFNEGTKEPANSNTDTVSKSNFEPFLTTTFYGKDRNSPTNGTVSENSTTSLPNDDSISQESIAFVSSNPEVTKKYNEPETDTTRIEPIASVPVPAIFEEHAETSSIADKFDMREAISPPDMADISTNMEIKGLEAVVKTIISDLDKKSNSDQDEVEENRESVDIKGDVEDTTDLQAPILERSEKPTEPAIPVERHLPPQTEEPLDEEMIEQPQEVEESLISQNVVEESADAVGVEGIETNSLTEEKDEVTEHGDVETNLEVSDANMTETDNTNVEDSVEDNNFIIEESAEDLAEKESILKALGLQSWRAAEQAKLKTSRGRSSKCADNYTGTLKTVIKINRDKKKGGKSKLALQKIKSKTAEEEQVEVEEKISKDVLPSTSKQSSQSSDTAGAHRKSHYSNRSNLDGSSEHTSDGEGTNQDGTIKALVIPEKASSFSIHPGRLCKDECSYCFGKFGLFDTPCHIAQMKSVERQDKILAAEKHLTRDSCLCDACYRHVDRKSNTPSYMNKSLKRSSLVAPGPRQNHCHVLGCNKVSTNILRRKWIIKMRKSICQVINIDLDNPGLHSIPICSEHYAALEHLMVCAMCKRRLARNHVHYLGSEVAALNEGLNKEDIPLNLSNRPVVCKLCKCFASILLKEPEERPENSVSFFNEYKKRLLHFNDIVPMDEAAAEEPIVVPTKPEKLEQFKKKKKTSKSTDSESQESPESPEKIQERVPSTDTSSQPCSRSESPSDDYNGVDYNTLIPAIAMECDSDNDSKKDGKRTPVLIKKIEKSMMLPESVEISKVIKPQLDKCKNSDIAVQKLGANPSISVRQLFPGEEDLPLNVHVDFSNIKDRTPEGWEKCSSIVQYDAETKRLWHELQKPYGNQSSFLRHLILLEKYFRNGDLVLSPRASHHSINYSESVHNRLRSYDNIPSSAGNIQPLSMIQFNKMQNRSSSGIITSGNGLSLNPIPSISQSTTITSIPKLIPNPVTITSAIPSNPSKAPLTISQLNSPPLIPAPKTILEGKLTEPAPLLQQARPKLGAPPGLISLHQNVTRPIAPLVKMPQSQKIKFPITKNWRPNLIPIDPNKKQERKAGLVQVISGGKPYHITLEDYKKMCAIKRSFEMKQKRLQEAQTNKPILVTHNSVLKSIIPRKGLIISKTPVKNELIPPPSIENNGDSENILDKLDKQVEKLESKLNEKSSQLLLPKIPKSLTVIPQTVTKRPSRPPSPALQITPKTMSKS